MSKINIEVPDTGNQEILELVDDTHSKVYDIEHRLTLVEISLGELLPIIRKALTFLPPEYNLTPVQVKDKEKGHPKSDAHAAKDKEKGHPKSDAAPDASPEELEQLLNDVPSKRNTF